MKKVKSSVDQSVLIRNPVVAVIIIDKEENAVPLAEALIAGGVKSIELTLRTEAATRSIRAIKRHVPEMTVGAGTLIFPEQVEAVVDAGADFAVAPGCNGAVIEKAVRAGLSFAPGVATPSDIETAISFGFRVLKFYPAEQMGGIAYLTAMTAPYRHLNLRFIPLGGVNLANLEQYAASPLVASVGGSWIAKRELIQSAEWKTITRNAQDAMNLINRIHKE